MMPHRLLASICGLTHKDNHSMLSIHETFGPWLSLRAVSINGTIAWQGGKVALLGV